MLESLNLPDSFLNISAHGRSQDLKALDDAIGINEKPSSGFNPGILVVNAVLFPNAAILVRKHGEGNIFANHFRELMGIPHLVHIDAVDAYRQDYNAKGLQLIIFFSNC